MTAFDEFLAANRTYTQTFAHGDMISPPRRRVVVLTCMDARMYPEHFLGLAVGDAHVLRNAGGRATEDALRSLVISQRLLGTREIVVIHHTDCGLVAFTNSSLAAKIQQELGVDVGDFDFLPFDDLEQSVRDDVQTLRASPLIPRDVPISGAIYDVRNGTLTEVVRA